MANIISCRLILFPLLISATGCSFAPCETPIYMMPAVLAVAPFALTAKMIDDNSPQRSNTDFILAGQIVDDQNQPVDSVETHVTRWIATHRHAGFADRWEQRTETHALNSQFTLDVKNAQALDIVLS